MAAELSKNIQIYIGLSVSLFSTILRPSCRVFRIANNSASQTSIFFLRYHKCSVSISEKVVPLIRYTLAPVSWLSNLDPSEQLIIQLWSEISLISSACFAAILSLSLSLSLSIAIGLATQGGCVLKPDSSIFSEEIDLDIEFRTLYSWVGQFFFLDLSSWFQSRNLAQSISVSSPVLNRNESGILFFIRCSQSS